MKHVLTSAAITYGLLAFSSASNAAYFDFQDWIANNGEKGFANSSPFALTDASLTLTATAYEQPSMIDSYVYMDGLFKSSIGGMGVCSAIDSFNQCINSADDNVSLDGSNAEILSWNFDQSISQLTLELGDSEHATFNSDILYSIDDGINWLTASSGVDGLATISLASSSTGIDFKTAGGALTDYFYIRNADVTVVPVPAAVFLFGSGLLALVGIARRRA